MTLFINFLTIAAWFGCVVGWLLVAAGAYSIITYEGSLEQKLDAVRGVKASWPRNKWFFLTALVSTIFLIAKAIS